MKTLEGELFKNKITKDLFKVKKVENEKVVILEDEKGFVQISLPKKHVGSLFRKIGRGTHHEN